LRAYADTSFLVKLISSEHGSEEAVAEYRRLHRPRLFYLPLHALEVENAARQKAFRQRRSLASGERSRVAREKNAVLSRLKWMVDGKQFVEVAADWDDAVSRARALSEKHTESTGARSFDLLHIAFALELESELFFTADACQGRIAKAEGLKLVTIAEAD
jgi:predicted nucleic acid-binding protein